MGGYRRFEFQDLAKISRASRQTKGAVCKGQGREKASTAHWLATSTSCRANMHSLSGWQPARPAGRTCVRLLAGNQHVLQGEHAFAYWLATSTSFRASMRSITGWQPARPSGRTCVRLLAGNQHVLPGELSLATSTSSGRACVRLFAGNQDVLRVRMRSLTGWQPARLLGRTCVR